MRMAMFGLRMCQIRLWVFPCPAVHRFGLSHNMSRILERNTPCQRHLPHQRQPISRSSISTLWCLVIFLPCYRTSPARITKSDCWPRSQLLLYFPIRPIQRRRTARQPHPVPKHKRPRRTRSSSRTPYRWLWCR